jgi:hypothetical protein
LRRVLVIQDVGLWIDLNRHLSGVASVDLVEALSFETGQLLAQIERPEIVIYGALNDGPGADEIAREFREAGLSEIQIVLIDESASTIDDSTAARTAAAGRPIVCSPDCLLGLISELLQLTDEEPEPCVELLAHYEYDTGENEVQRGFAVILELTERHLAIESDVPLEAGNEVRMNFFLADPDGNAQRVKISLSCVVAQCRDEAKLIYSARISEIPDAAKRALQLWKALGAGVAS